MDIDAEELFQLPALPLASTQCRFGFRHPARHRQHQREGEIGGRIVQHTRRVGGHHATPRAGGEVDVVCAHRDVAHRFQFRALLEQCFVHPID